MESKDHEHHDHLRRTSLASCTTEDVKTPPAELSPIIFVNLAGRY